MSESDTKVLRGAQSNTPVVTQFVPDLPRFGRFQTAAELGSGAMGTVFRAHDDALGRTVAIKALQAHEDPGIRERFLREARAIGAVHHPNILAIYDAGTEGGIPYIVMELAAGGSLWDQMKTGRVAAEVVRQVGIQIARALAAAHAARILHRDVKPANILSTAPGVWKLADFGIARLPDSKLTATGQFLGSPSYAAPEALQTGEASPASDVYSLGVTLYEALAGSPPYGDHDVPSVMKKLVEDPPPVQSRVSVPGSLGSAIMAALARNPAQRPTAEQLASLLAASEPMLDPVSLPPPPVVGAQPWSRRRKLVAAAIAAVVLIAIVFGMRSRSTPAASAKSAPAEEAPATDDEPMVLDENGNPVDEETRRQVLDQMQRDNDHPGRGRGKRKHAD